MSSSNLLNSFNNHFFEFIFDIQKVFPDDTDLQTAINYMTIIRKANPRLILTIWKTKISSNYYQEIKDGNLEFFLEKDYSTDIIDAKNSGQIVNCINRLKHQISQMSKENQNKSMKYIQNLTELSLLL